MGRNLDLLDSGPRTDALDVHNQSMHSQGSQSFGSHRLDLTWVSAYNPVTTRSRRSSTYGTPMSPPAPKQDKENPQYSNQEILNFATLIYVKSGTEEDANGVPGTMPPIYTPRPIAVGPHLPYYGRPGWPLSLDVADEMMTLLAIRGSQWSKTRPLTVEPPPGALSIKKKAKSAKAIKVEQEDDDDDFTLKSVRKVSSTPTASQKKKKAQRSPTCISLSRAHTTLSELSRVCACSLTRVTFASRTAPVAPCGMSACSESCRSRGLSSSAYNPVISNTLSICSIL